MNRDDFEKAQQIDVDIAYIKNLIKDLEDIKERSDVLKVTLSDIDSTEYTLSGQQIDIFIYNETTRLQQQIFDLEVAFALIGKGAEEKK